jgi:hypothetical protein
MRGLAAISAAAAFMAVAAAPGEAALTTRIPAAPINGPVVAGGEATWAVTRADEGFNLIGARPGGGYRTLQRFPSYKDPNGHDSYLVPQLSVAGDRVGLAIDAGPIPFDRYDSDLAPVGADVMLGTAGAPLQPVLQCRPGLPIPTTAAVTQDGMVLPGPSCDDARAHGMALRSDGGEPRPLTPDGARPRAAGRFVGWVNGSNEIVVYDTGAAAIAYRTANLRSIADWDLQDDGKVAVAVAAAPFAPADLRWYSPDDPSPHAVPVPAAPNWDVHISGDRIAYLAGNSGSYYFGRLGVADLDRHARTITNRAIGVEGSHPALAFDGSNVTWAAPACSGATLQSRSVDEPPVVGPRPRCPLTFRRKPRLLGKSAIRIPLRCSGFVLPDCSGSEVTLDTMKGHVRLGSDVSRYCDQTADVPLGRRGRALVRKLKTLRVRATVAATDTGRQREVRSATFTIRMRERITHPLACEDDF